MIEVSREFQEEIRKPRRKTRVELMLRTVAPYAVYNFGDEAVIADSLTITDQLTGGKFGFGGVYSQNVSVKIDADKINGLDPFNIDLTGALLYITFYLTIPQKGDVEEHEESVFLGGYWIDNNKATRQKNVLALYGSDKMAQLDKPVSERSGSVYDLAHDVLWGDARQNIKNSREEIEALPNGTKSFSIKGGQIQSVRDAVMWLGDLTGTFVREERDRNGYGYIEFVQIPTKYTKAGTSGNFDLATFKADNGSIIPANVRISTEYTDTSIRPTKFTTRHGKNPVSVERSWTAAPNTLFGTIEFQENPLLADLSDSAVEACLTEIADYTEDLRFCPFSVKFNGNPAITCGDFVYLEPGGNIDDTQFYHYGIVTYYKWKYRGTSEIRCATDIAAERPPQTSTLALSEPSVQAESSESISAKPKSQLEKRIDGLSGQGGDKAKELVGAFNGFSGDYVFKWISPYEIAAINPQGEKMFYFLALNNGIELSSTQSSSGPCFEIKTTGNGLVIDSKGGENHIELAQGNITIRSQNTKFSARDNGYFEISAGNGTNTFYVNPSTGYMEFKAGNGSFFVDLQHGEIKINGRNVKLE